MKNDPAVKKDSIDLDELALRALRAAKRAYAPYSGYMVGCAISAGGTIYEGVNVENASYSLAMCAERSAVAIAVSSGAQRIDAVAVATGSSPPAAPCGACLQTLTEFAGDPHEMRLVLVNPHGERRDLTLADCLPFGFRKDQLTE